MVSSFSPSSDPVILLMVAAGVSLVYLRCLLSSFLHISLRGTLHAFIKTSSLALSFANASLKDVFVSFS